MAITVILADDHKIIRDGLRTLIESQQGMQVIAEAENGRETIKLAKELQPNVVIMDISMPDLNGIDATGKSSTAFRGKGYRAFHAFRPAVRIGNAFRRGFRVSLERLRL
jgi:DNA-binding LytR/AlgR family response regulator